MCFEIGDLVKFKDPDYDYDKITGLLIEMKDTWGYPSALVLWSDNTIPEWVCILDITKENND